MKHQETNRRNQIKFKGESEKVFKAGTKEFFLIFTPILKKRGA